jgi:hypothetical protein
MTTFARLVFTPADKRWEVKLSALGSNASGK